MATFTDNTPLYAYVIEKIIYLPEGSHRVAVRDVTALSGVTPENRTISVAGLATIRVSHEKLGYFDLRQGKVLLCKGAGVADANITACVTKEVFRKFYYAGPLTAGDENVPMISSTEDIMKRADAIEKAAESLLVNATTVFTKSFTSEANLHRSFSNIVKELMWIRRQVFKYRNRHPEK